MGEITISNVSFSEYLVLYLKVNSERRSQDCLLVVVICSFSGSNSTSRLALSFFVMLEVVPTVRVVTVTTVLVVEVTYRSFSDVIL